MTLLNKLVLAFLIFVTGLGLYSSYQSAKYKAAFRKLEKQKAFELIERRDSIHAARYKVYRDSMTAEYNKVLNDLTIARKKTQEAERKSFAARKKSNKADEERSLIHLHPDSLPRF